MKTLPPVVVITGPTACGKSALALQVALAFDGVIINADSMQVYQELPILSAHPGDNAMAQVPHRLYGVMSASQPCSAGHWLNMASAEITAAHAQNKLPIVTGGTGLYLRALISGLAPIPDIPKDIRQQARALHDRLGAEAFRDELAKVDAESANNIKLNDPQRLIRAYEVFLSTGVSLGQWQQRQRPDAGFAARFAAVVLAPAKETLYQIIDSRFERMMTDGLMDEVLALKNKGMDQSLPAMKALGVPQLMAHLAGDISLDEAVEKAKRTSRNFAKRQLTWLRNQDIGCQAKTYSTQYLESIKDEIFSFVRKFVLTTQS